MAAMALFLIPVDRAKGVHVIDWPTAVKLPWGVLILFGGGLALAAATEANGVAQYIGSLARGFSGWPVAAVVVVVIALMVFMSELTSNTAQVATMLPILAALAPVLDVPPALLLLPATIAASCAFMMPVGTPPNAIVFGTGLVRMPQMMKAGLWLNLTGILLITGITYLVIAPLLLAARCPAHPQARSRPASFAGRTERPARAQLELRRAPGVARQTGVPASPFRLPLHARGHGS
jgi:sodium-dependent dicarboxylate transporter 2/3/5